MKKLLVLTLVVSMFAFAGVSFADDKAGHDEVGHNADGTVSIKTDATAVKNAVSETTQNAFNDTGFAAIATVLNANTYPAGTTSASIYAAIDTATAKATSAISTAKTGTIGNTTASSDLATPSGTVLLTGDAFATSPDATVVAKAAVLKLKNSGYTPVPLPPIDTSKLSADASYEFVLFNPTVVGDFTTAQASVKFYKDDGTEVPSTSKNIYIAYSNGSSSNSSKGDVYPATSISGDHALKEAGTYAKLRFVYNGTPSTGVSAADTLDLMLAGATTTVTDETKAASGSGGGCVAGTSAAALALAVLGFVTAKRRA